jgi:predicted O-methyltransferase YrrM
MSNKTLNLTDELYQYLLKVSLHESELMAALRKETATLSMSVMQISPEQGQFMALLVKLLGAKRVIEVGTFTGYSALAVAQALPADGEVIACDVSEEWTSMAKRYWEQAGMADRIDLRLAPALVTLDGLLQEGRAGNFDMAFIDADKENYLNYYERCLELLRSGGLIMVDNVLWDGSVIDVSNHETETVAIRKLNEHVYQDSRVDISLVPIGDGMMLARKR